jgi:PhnB protein
MKVQPYLFFDGRCEEALDFYRAALGAEVEMMMRFKEAPEPCPEPVAEDKIMHASFKIGDTVIMASDGMCKNDTSFHGFSLAITVPEVAQAERLFNALAEGGQVQMPMDKTFFATRFGMVADRFGVSWMILAE